MLHADSSLTSNHKRHLTSYPSLFKNTLILGSYLWDVFFFFLFCMIQMSLIEFEGFSLITHVLIGLAYILTIGRRGLFSRHEVLSLALLPCVAPGYIFLISSLVTSPGSNLQDIVELGAGILLAQWPVLFQPEQGQVEFRSIIKKLIFFVTLQGLYGVMLQSYNPALFEPLEWRVTGVGLKPDHRYPSKTGIQFFYEDLSEAEELEVHLPEVLATLQSSPFYRNSKELVFVQKNRLPTDGLIRESSPYTRGGCYAFKQYSYYFSDPNKSFSIDPVYYSHNNTYRSVAIHEITHQLLSRYYGKWNAMIFIETWKNEGYAEYMANTGFYLTKDELLALIISYPISDAILAAPFTQAQPDQEDYMAAFLQTRYALDGKKQSPIEFMKRSYKPVSAQEIKDWLTEESSK